MLACCADMAVWVSSCTTPAAKLNACAKNSCITAFFILSMRRLLVHQASPPPPRLAAMRQDFIRSSHGRSQQNITSPCRPPTMGRNDIT